MCLCRLQIEAQPKQWAKKSFGTGRKPGDGTYDVASPEFVADNNDTSCVSWDPNGQCNCYGLFLSDSMCGGHDEFFCQSSGRFPGRSHLTKSLHLVSHHGKHLCPFPCGACFDLQCFACGDPMLPCTPQPKQQSCRSNGRLKSLFTKCALHRAASNWRSRSNESSPHLTGMHA